MVASSSHCIGTPRPNSGVVESIYGKAELGCAASLIMSLPGLLALVRIWPAGAGGGLIWCIRPYNKDPTI